MSLSTVSVSLGLVVVWLMVLLSTAQPPDNLSNNGKGAPVYGADDEDAVPDEFFIELKNPSSKAQNKRARQALVKSFGAKGRKIGRGARGKPLGDDIEYLDDDEEGNVALEVENKVNLLFIRANGKNIQAIRNNPNVEKITANKRDVDEQDKWCSVLTTTSEPGKRWSHYVEEPWHLDMLDPPDCGPNMTDTFYSNYNAGRNVNIFVLDGGLWNKSAHLTLEGVTAKWFESLCHLMPPETWGEPCTDWEDVNGHGTSVAGAAFGPFGSAWYAQIHAIKLRNDNGIGDDVTSAVATKMVTEWYNNNGKPPTVIIMSISRGPLPLDAGPQYREQFIQEALDSGITVVVAAGNQGYDARQRTPARMGLTSDVITVGATDKCRIRAPKSNYGEAVTVYAPGGNGLWHPDYPCSGQIPGPCPSFLANGDTSAICYSDGTSLAAPIVAGLAARYLEANPTASPAQVKNFFASTSCSVTDDAGTFNFVHVPHCF